MANHKSSVKRARQEKTRTARNKKNVSETRSAIKAVRLAITEKKKEEAAKLLVNTQSLLAKLAKRGVIKANTAARKTSRLAKAIASL